MYVMKALLYDKEKGSFRRPRLILSTDADGHAGEAKELSHLSFCYSMLLFRLAREVQQQLMSALARISY